MSHIQLTHEEEMALGPLITAVRRRVKLGEQLRAGMAVENETYSAWRKAARHEMDMQTMFCAALSESARQSLASEAEAEPEELGEDLAS